MGNEIKIARAGFSPLPFLLEKKFIKSFNLILIFFQIL